MRARAFAIWAILFLTAAPALAQTQQHTPESRATAFLVREVHLWRGKNGCFSCHNNGDAARALFVAQRAGLLVPEQMLKQTKAWLLAPADWDDNGGEGEFNDKQLARLQFAYALLTAVETGAVKDAQDAMQQAAALVAGHQQDDGCWRTTVGTNVGSPVTYGPVLATIAAKRVLSAVDDDRYTRRIEKANDWLLAQRPKNVLDCAALLLGRLLEPAGETQDAADQRRHCLDILRRGQHQDGGWGPYVDARSEAFDTALALLALRGPSKSEKGVGQMIQRGRAFLIEEQLDDGSWPATTRPSGDESYAHRLSTSGWALLALLKSRPAAE